MKTITMTDFRKGPGYFIFRVFHDRESFILTQAGKPVAKLVPLDDSIEITSDGKIKGEKPVTLGLKLGGEYAHA